MTTPDKLGAFYPAAIAMVGFFLSLLLEKLAQPRCPGWRRPLFSALLHGGLLLVAWATALLVVRRPAFALMLVLAGQLVVIQINNAKYRALREPFLFSDFGIFSQTIRHPRLYLPFLGIGRSTMIALAIVIAVAFGWWVEKPLPDFALWSGAAALIGVFLGCGGLMSDKPPSLDPEKDLSQHGLFTSIAQYWLRERAVQPSRQTRLPAIRGNKTDLPDIVVIQSESFFDARRIWPGIKPQVLANYDLACANAALHGRLEVPAWGANTMRPEFCFLTGLPPESLDVHRFNPYRQLARRPLPALPTILREAGYLTTCLHPHPARFFRRDRAFPNLGFERFIDDSSFRGAKKCGAYISDEAVTDKLLVELPDNRTPSFFFVITMENHGPLHLESIKPEEVDGFYHGAPPISCEELAIYLRHLQNADRQLGRLLEHLSARTRPTVLCFYGEHLPSMPRVYDELGLPDGRTDYFLTVTNEGHPHRADLRIEQLAGLILCRL
jgi:hypothetical protein